MGKPKSAEPVPIPMLSKNHKSNPTNRNRKLNCGTWNICGGLITREHELKQLLKDESIDILFITETDATMLPTENDYLIDGYKTIFPKRNENSEKIRILCLIKKEISDDLQILNENMDSDFPSIWLEKTKKENNSETNSLAIGGFYRVWSHNGENSELSQIIRINMFTRQIELAAAKYKDVLILGDANLDANNC